MATSDTLPANPLLSPWTTPDAVPPYDLILPSHYEPAFDAAIADAKQGYEEIATNPADATFENTIEAMERVGALLSRVQGAFSTVSQADATAEIQQVQANVAKKLTRHRSEIYLDPRLFARVSSLWKNRASLTLTPEQSRLLEVIRTTFIRAGADLTEDERTRIAGIDRDLSSLQVKFSQNLLADQKAGDLFLGEAEISGLSAEMRASAAAKASAAGRAGEFLISSTRSDVEPFLTLATNRAAREKVFRKFNGRGDNRNSNDNNPLISAIIRLRIQRAKLLGYDNFAAYQLDQSMAKTPQAAMDLLMQVYTPALVRASEEAADLLKLAAKDGVTEIEAWDWRFYAEKVRAERHDFDEATLKEYLPLDGMVEAMIATTTRLFGLTFHLRPELPVYADGVKVWEIREADGSKVGLFYADWFARDTKKPGAWMNSIRVQSDLLGELPAVVNNCNYTPPAEGARATISADDLSVLFHEFGHALHGLLAKVRYPALSGPGRTIFTDFVELPSLIYENWATEPDILRAFARNAKGEPIPESLITSLLGARHFNQGFLNVQQLSSAILDMELHLMDSLPEDFSPSDWETSALARLGVPDAIGMRHRLAHFSHLFDSGYAAKYYSYTWSEAMAADGFEAFTEAGNPFDPATAKRFRSEVLEVGNTRDPAASYTAFRGRGVRADALLKSRGLGGSR